MQTILLAGGLGSSLAEETVTIPKPMVEVGGRPIITRVMDIYSHFGHNDFIVAAGYKSLCIKQYFANYHLVANNITVSLDSGKMDFVPASPGGWNVSVVDTGPRTMSSGRIRRLKEWLRPGPFMVTYSDGLGNIDINALIEFHKSHGKLATITAVQPPARFGGIELDGERVEAFTEKVSQSDTWINGGFFIFEPEVMDYFVDDMEPLEQSPLRQMAQDCELMAFKHEGFWHPMDTIRDRNMLDDLCEEETPPWLRFNEERPSDITALAM
ncbi:glucose-1-phosphate cytidylyltransferase [uncultured Aliiroseovarius sp.]|uniref:glucose-1-phosphate cytidylyltransferase n=1 Tax=uncultured Aliiroseovarius sp. TaxID=1658783 RepID=UPI00260CC329|nr:glucose-1-phosphate cytidylyltransferase [uncultured Aliiroseovarius sp.]